MSRIAALVLCAFVFTIPWEKSITIPGVGTLTRLAGMIALAFGAISAVQRRRIRPPNLVLVLAAGFVAWSAATWFWSLDPAATVARAFTYAQLLAMAWLVWEICRSEESQRCLMQMYVAGAVVAACATMLRYAQNLQTYYRRYAAPGFDPNDLGITVALAIPLALYLALRGGSVVAWLNRIAVALVCAAILLTASRTALVAAFLAFGFAAWTWRESTRAQRASVIVLASLLLLGPVVLAPPAARERLSTIAKEVSTGTLHKRTTIWKAGLKALKQYPLAGAGAGAYPDAVRPYIGVPARAGHEYVAHNTFLSVLVETGLIGFALYALLLAALALFVWAMPGADRALWTIMLLVCAAGASTLTWEHRKPVWLLFAMIAAGWANSFSPRPAGEHVPE